jgi:hypothetical protein
MARDRQTGQRPVRSIRISVLGFFLCFFVLLSSGRLGSFDAGQQLSATTLAVTQGALGSANPPVKSFWVRSPNGLYYEPHDLGAIVLMAPSAWLGAKLDHSGAAAQFLNPPLLAKVGVSLTYAVVGAIGCLFLFLLFNEFYSARQAFIITFAFAAGSLYLPYAKVTWDVAPCAAAMCAFLYYTHGLLRPGAGWRAFAAAGCALAITALFRYSIAPALIVALVFLAWRTRGSLRHYAILAATFIICTGPTWLYNAVRTGSPLRPATATDYYLNGGNALHGDMLHGLIGLLAGANRGLIVYSPIVLVCLFLPWVWRRLEGRQRAMIQAMMLGMLLYTLMIAKMNHWGAFGWGPRYLLPCLPIVFLIIGPGLIEISYRSRLFAAAIVVAAIAFNVAPATTNWNVIVSEYPGAEIQDAGAPYVLEGIWTGFFRGLRGEPLIFANSDPQFSEKDDGRKFPDLWTAKLMERSHASRIAGWGIVSMLILGMALAWGRIFSPRRQRDGLTDAALRVLVQDASGRPPHDAPNANV